LSDQSHELHAGGHTRRCTTIRSLARVAIAAIVVVACNADDDASESYEPYFLQLQSIVLDAGARYGELTDERASASDPALDFSARKAASLQYLDSYLAVVDDVQDRITALDAPSDLNDAHRRFIEAQRAFQPLTARARAAAVEASTADELEQAFAALGEEFERANATFIPACQALQTAAQDRDISANLRCT
jgi:hypothetical protein